MANKLVDTVCGQIPVSELGLVSPHEHCQWAQRLDREKLLLSELADYKRAGGSTIMEMSTPSICPYEDRDAAVDFFEKVSLASGVNIVYGAGFYKEPRLPQFVSEKTVEELADIMIGELRDGRGINRRRAGFIGEVGSSNYQVYDTEEKVLRAAARASLETGSGISTHTGRGSMYREQLHFFTAEGVDPEKIVIGHQDVYPRMWERMDDYLYILDSGATVQFDCSGKQGYFEIDLDPDYGQKFPYDEQRASVIASLVRKGYIKQIMISCDIDGPMLTRGDGGWGYAHLLTSFVSLLRFEGLTEYEINQIIVENTHRFLSWKRC